jgi:hypothetical protein
MVAQKELRINNYSSGKLGKTCEKQRVILPLFAIFAKAPRHHEL